MFWGYKLSCRSGNSYQVDNKSTIFVENIYLKAPKSTRGPTMRTSKSSGGVAQPPLSIHWDSIIRFLDTLMDRLRENFVSFSMLICLEIHCLLIFAYSLSFHLVCPVLKYFIKLLIFLMINLLITKLRIFSSVIDVWHSHLKQYSQKILCNIK